MSENDRRQRRIVERRMNRQNRVGTAQVIKTVLLRSINIIVILAFIVAMECILFNRIVLKWILIISFAVAFTELIESKVKQIKTSPRNGHSSRGHA